MLRDFKGRLTRRWLESKRMHILRRVKLGKRAVRVYGRRAKEERGLEKRAE